jgi:PAS domain S-box-containing protein
MPATGKMTAWVATLGGAFGIAIIYFLAAHIGLALLAKPSDIAVFWPASGIAAGILVAVGRRAGAAVVVGVVVGTVTANLISDRNFLTAILKGFCNAGEAVLMAWLLGRWFGRPFTFSNLRRVIGFFAAAALATGTSAIGGAVTMTTLHTSAPFWDAWRTWFLSDAVGIIIVAPLLIELCQLGPGQSSRRELVEGAGILALTALASVYAVSLPAGTWLSFDTDAIVLPLLLWLAARNLPTFAVAGALAVSIMVIGATTYGIGHFGDVGVSVVERVLGAQLVATTVTAFTLVVTTLLAERRKSEEGLRESEERLRLAQLKTGVGIWDWNVLAGKVTWTPQLETLYGLQQGTVTSYADFRDRVHPDDIAAVEAHRNAAVRRKETFNSEFRIIRADGEVRWISAVGGAFYNEATGEPVRILGNYTDITDRKLAEQTLAERNAQFALASRAARVGRYAYDFDSDRMQVSEGYAAIHGLPEGTTETSRRLWRARAPEDAEQVEARRLQAIRDRQTEYTVVYRIILPDRGVRWIESRSFIAYDGDWHPKRVVGVNIDVTERRRTEQALIDRNNQIALSGKTALVGSFAIHIDPAREHVAQRMRVSPGFAAIFGLVPELEEISVGDWRSRVYPADLPQFLAHRHQAIAERRSEHHLEYRIVRPCGTIRWIESRTSIEYDEVGQPSRLVGVNIDITERKKLEEQRKLLIGELDHRVKNTLSTVSAVISRTGEGSRSLADFVAALDGRIRSMAKTHELLSAHRWQGVSLTQLIRNELAPFATGSNTDLEGPEVILTPEAGQAMAMVLHELVTNAAKYGALSTQSGRVVIRWDRRLNGHLRSHLMLEWRETGGPPVIASAGPSYGMSIIRDLLPYEFGATVDLVLAADGVRCRLELSAEWFNNHTEPVPEAGTLTPLRTVDP